MNLYIFFRRGGGQEIAIKLVATNILPDHYRIIYKEIPDGKSLLKILSKIQLAFSVVFKPGKLIINSPDVLILAVLFVLRRKHLAVMHSTELFGRKIPGFKDKILQYFLSSGKCTVGFVSKEHYSGSSTKLRSAFWTPNFVPPYKNYKEARDNCLRDINESYKKKVDIIFIGRLSTEKRPQFAIDLSNLIASRLPHYDFRLYIYGDGPLQENIMEYIGSANICSNLIVEMKGYVKDPALNHFSASNNQIILISVSERECFPLGIIEAVQLGIPVISTNVFTGPAEILTEFSMYSSDIKTPLLTKHGILINSDWHKLIEEVDELMNKILFLLSNKRDETFLPNAVTIASAKTQWKMALEKI